MSSIFWFCAPDVEQIGRTHVFRCAAVNCDSDAVTTEEVLPAMRVERVAAVGRPAEGSATAGTVAIGVAAACCDVLWVEAACPVAGVTAVRSAAGMALAGELAEIAAAAGCAAFWIVAACVSSDSAIAGPGVAGVAGASDVAPSGVELRRAELGRVEVRS